jgi:hypothetical protein
VNVIYKSLSYVCVNGGAEVGDKKYPKSETSKELQR